MDTQAIKELVPEWAKDIRLNWSAQLRSVQHLTDEQRWGTIWTCALALGYEPLTEALRESAEAELKPEARNAARLAASLMAMNNIYYRFVHLSSNEAYATMSAGLRMQAMANPGVDKSDFELWSLAVSALNGCGMCIDAHERQLRQHNVSQETIQAVVKIAAIMNAVVSTAKMNAVSETAAV